MEVLGQKQFFSSGHSYRQLFNVSLCGGSDVSDEMATCSLNVTLENDDIDVSN